MGSSSVNSLMPSCVWALAGGLDGGALPDFGLNPFCFSNVDCEGEWYCVALLILLLNGLRKRFELYAPCLL